MFDRFTDRARRVIVLAQAEARRLNHDWVGTEHLLLGMVAEGEGVAAQALRNLGVDDLPALRGAVEHMYPAGPVPPPPNVAWEKQASRMLEFGLREALTLGHPYVGTEHLLLALLRHELTPGMQVLAGVGIESDLVRAEVMRILKGCGQAKADPRLTAVADMSPDEVVAAFTAAAKILTAAFAAITPVVTQVFAAFEQLAKRLESRDEVTGAEKD